MPPERRVASRNVLVVDHDKDSAERLARLLRRVGSEVQLVQDGPSALEVDRSWFRPHIVLIDLGLPGMDAYTVARLVRAYPYRKVALVALAGSLTAKDRRRAKEAGFNYRLRKPVRLARLQAMFVALGVADQTGANVVRNAMALYHGGILTKEEFILRVLEGGARHHPAKMAARLPRYLLDAIRKATESPAPNVPYLLRDSLLSAEEIEAKSESTGNGFCRWRRFFTAEVLGNSPRGFGTDLGSNTAPENDKDAPYLPYGVPVATYTSTDIEFAMPLPLRPHRILLVYCAKPDAEELATPLRQAGHTVEIAYDQQSALELERTVGPEMVIIPIGLSGPDPNAIARALRAQASRDFILASAGQNTRDRIALRTCFDDHLREQKNGSLFLMRRRKEVVSHYETVEEMVELLLARANNRRAYLADEQFVICMLAVAVFPSSPPALAPLIPEEFLRKIRAFAESPTDLANYLIVYKQKVFAEAEYWEDVVKGASLWSRYFNP